MASLEDLKQRLQAIRAEFQRQLPEIATTVALAGKAVAERNIKEKGFGATYSANKYPAFFLYGKELNGSGTTFLKNHGVDTATGKQGEGKTKRRKKGEAGPKEKFDTLTNWSEFRQAQGLQNAHVDLSYTNKMFANMQVVKVDEEGTIARAWLGATNTEAQNKMNWNFERYGDFIGKAIDPEARKAINEFVINKLKQIVKSIP